jgi:molybdopterin molybdotransferase
MLSVAEAQKQILTQFQPLEPVSVALKQALGRVLAEPVCAPADFPAFDHSSVDGFAVQASQVTAASPEQAVRLKVVGDIPAGSAPTFRVGPGEAARIMTGAPLPPGADAVVMVEETDVFQQVPGQAAPEQVAIFKAVQHSENVRRRGSDLQTGQELLPSGQRLRPQDLGLLAMLGQAHLAVFRQPRVALISSGDELLPVEAPLEPGKIHDSNTYSLAALAQNAGCQVMLPGLAADQREAVQALLDQAADLQPDVIISSAGVSVGAFDYVKSVVENNGSLGFWKVNMRPGKPLAFGEYRGIPFFGLPGNPVSAFVSFLVFVEPALGRLSGLQTEDRPRVRVILEEPIESDGRESYLRAIVQSKNGQYFARLTGHQGSGNLFSLVQANALLIFPSGVKSCPPGSEAEAWLLPG